MLERDCVVKFLLHPAAFGEMLGEEGTGVESLALTYQCSLKVSNDLHPVFGYHVVTVKSPDMSTILRIIDIVRQLNVKTAKASDVILLLSDKAATKMYPKFRELSVEFSLSVTCQRRRDMVQGLPERWLIVGCGKYELIANCIERLLVMLSTVVQPEFVLPYCSFPLLTPSRLRSQTVGASKKSEAQKSKAERKRKKKTKTTGSTDANVRAVAKPSGDGKTKKRRKTKSSESTENKRGTKKQKVVPRVPKGEFVPVCDSASPAIFKEDRGIVMRVPLTKSKPLTLIKLASPETPCTVFKSELVDSDINLTSTPIVPRRPHSAGGRTSKDSSTSSILLLPSPSVGQGKENRLPPPLVSFKEVTPSGKMRSMPKLVPIAELSGYTAYK